MNSNQINEVIRAYFREAKNLPDDADAHNYSQFGDSEVIADVMAYGENGSKSYSVKISIQVIED